MDCHTSSILDDFLLLSPPLSVHHQQAPTTARSQPQPKEGYRRLCLYFWSCHCPSTQYRSRPSINQTKEETHNSSPAFALNSYGSFSLSLFSYFNFSLVRTTIMETAYLGTGTEVDKVCLSLSLYLLTEPHKPSNNLTLLHSYHTHSYSLSFSLFRYLLSFQT